MRKELRAGEWAAAEAGAWETEIGEGALVQVFSPSTGLVVGAFYGEGVALEQELRKAWRQARLGAGEWAVKLIVHVSQEPCSRKTLADLRLHAAKVVLRSARCRVIYEAGKLLLEAEVGAKIVAKARTKVLIVDDSPTIRTILRKIFAGDPEMEVVASVGLPSEVRPAIEKFRPDVITLDIHLPEMNGVELLK